LCKRLNIDIKCNKCENEQRSKRHCSCKKCEKKCCDKRCDIKIRHLKDRFPIEYQAISYISNNHALIIPSDGISKWFVYDFDCEKSDFDIVSGSDNCITVGTITDATVVDCHGDFWILSVTCPQTGGMIPGAAIVASNIKCVSLIKCHYNECKRSVSFLSKFDVHEVHGCGCECPKTIPCPLYQGLAKVSENEFFLFADGAAVATCQGSGGVAFVLIKDFKVHSYPVKISVNDYEISDAKYDSYGISTAFTVKDGVIFVPQFPEKQCDRVFKISNGEIRNLKRDISKKYNNISLTITLFGSIRQDVS
jgi:hypothetical protein